MGLATEVRNSAQALQGAAYALAHVLRTPPGTLSYDGLPDGSSTSDTAQDDSFVEEGRESVDARQEAEAICYTVRAVMEEAAPVLALLEQDAVVVRGGELGSRVQNGFGSLCAILVTLLDHGTASVLAIAGPNGRLVSGGLQGLIERMKTHHNQLRALYGILHLAAKVVSRGDVTKTLFVDVPRGHVEDDFDPRKWRHAINMDDFYGRWFGFHYAPHMRNVLRVVNIVRGSVNQAVSDPNVQAAPHMVKNVFMLGWGWVYTNMILMNNFGVRFEAARKLGADTEHGMSVETLRTFMNLVEDPLIAGVTNLASADTAIDRAFQIPCPPRYKDSAALEAGFQHFVSFGSFPEDVNYELLHEVWCSVDANVKVRLISAKKRPFSLNDLEPSPGPAPRRWSEEVLRTESPVDVVEDSTDTDVVPIFQAEPNGSASKSQRTRRVSIDVSAPATVARKAPGSAPPPTTTVTASNAASPPPPRKSPLAAVAESSYLASALKTEFTKLSSNVSSLLGLSLAEPARSLILHFHGGGFVAQSSLGHSAYLKEWCSSMTDSVALAVDYRLAPEYAYPTALHECLYAYVWALKHCEALGCRAERVVLVGDSAGGNLALGVALLARRLGLRQPDGVALAYPSLYLEVAWSPSRLLSFFDPMLPLSVMELCVSSYLGETHAHHANEDALISPIVASDEELRSLPPITAVVGALDPLLDDTCLLAHRLRTCGRNVANGTLTGTTSGTDMGDNVRIYDAMPHGFLNMIQVSEQARAASAFLGRRMAGFLDIPYGKTETLGSLVSSPQPQPDSLLR